MLNTFIMLIVAIVVLALLWYALNLALSLLPIDARIRTVITILAIVLLALFIASWFGLADFAW